MPLPRQIFAPSFRHQKLSVLFAVMVGIMVYVATFAMAAEATLSAMTLRWDKNMESRMTVELPLRGDEATVSRPDLAQQVMAVLRGMPEVASVNLVPDEETTRLLKPWFSQPDALKILPLPALIDVTRKPGAVLDAATLETRLKNIAPDAHVDDHAAWLGDLNHLVRALTSIGALTILLAALMLIICVSLVCRAIMATERDTLSLLHIMGAEDADIAANFQFHAQRVAASAAWLGFFAALLSAAAALFFLKRFADPALLEPLHWAGLGAAVIAVPFAAIVIASWSARWSALKLLHAMP